MASIVSVVGKCARVGVASGRRGAHCASTLGVVSSVPTGLSPSPSVAARWVGGGYRGLSSSSVDTATATAPASQPSASPSASKPGVGGGAKGGARAKRPTARKSGGPGSKSPVAAALFGTLATVTAGAGYYVYQSGKTPQQLWDDLLADLSSRFKDAADPDPQFLLHALPQIPAFVNQSDVITVAIALEGTLVHKKWDRKFGFRYQLRPGAVELLMGLSDLARRQAKPMEIVIWSEQSMPAAEEVILKLINACPGPVQLGGLLGREHMYTRNHKGVKIIDHLPRSTPQVLLIDHHQSTFENQPRNTLLVPEVTDTSEKDDTLFSVLAACSKYFDERVSGNVSSVPAFLRRYSGGMGRVDPAKIMESIQQEARNREHAKVQRETRGLGGVLRRMRDRSAVIKNSRGISSTSTASDVKVPEGSLLEIQRKRMEDRHRKMVEAAEKRAREAAEKKSS